MIQPAMQISIRRIFFSCILARKNHIAIAANYSFQMEGLQALNPEQTPLYAAIRL